MAATNTNVGNMITSFKRREEHSSGTSASTPQEATMKSTADAQFKRGLQYYNGSGVAKDTKKAFECFELAAKQGYAAAECYLGLYYYHGLGVAKDTNKAFKYYELAAKKGNAGAQCGLGLCYYLGSGVTKDVKKAFECYELAAKQGYAVAQFNLGFCYDNGRGVAKDAKKAFEYYELAVKQGYAIAQYNLGVRYANGIGGAKDTNKAFECFELAAQQGQTDAQYNLGVCYANGIGVAKDTNKAFEYYNLSAKKGDAGAQRNLGVCYENGNGVTKDTKKALEYYELAAKQGDAQAQVLHQSLLKQLPTSPVTASDPTTSPVAQSIEKSGHDKQHNEETAINPIATAAVNASVVTEEITQSPLLDVQTNLEVSSETNSSTKVAPVLFMSVTPTPLPPKSTKQSDVREIAQKMIEELQKYIDKSDKERKETSVPMLSVQAFSSFVDGLLFPSPSLVTKAFGANKSIKIQNAQSIKDKLKVSPITIESFNQILDEFSELDTKAGGGTNIPALIKKYKEKLEAIKISPTHIKTGTLGKL